MGKRSGGKGLVFYDILGEGSKVQIFADAKKFTDFASMEKDEALAAFMKLANTIKRGDVIGVVGQPGKTKRGELSIFPSSMQLLTPCLHMIPKAGVAGSLAQETRYRQRYLDLMLNPCARRTSDARAHPREAPRRGQPRAAGCWAGPGAPVRLAGMLLAEAWRCGGAQRRARSSRRARRS